MNVKAEFDNVLTNEKCMNKLRKVSLEKRDRKEAV